MNNPAKDYDGKMTVSVAKKILPETVKKVGLNPREFKFIAAYVTNGFDGEEAAHAAGFYGNTVAGYGIIANQLLSRPNIRTALNQYMERRREMAAERIPFTLYDITLKRATYNVAMFYDEKKKLKPIDQIPKEWLCVIDGIDGKKYILPDRDIALAMLAKLNGMDEARPQDPGEVRKVVQAAFQAAMLKNDAEQALKAIAKKPKPRLRKVKAIPMDE